MHKLNKFNKLNKINKIKDKIYYISRCYDLCEDI